MTGSAEGCLSRYIMCEMNTDNEKINGLLEVKYIEDDFILYIVVRISKGCGQYNFNMKEHHHNFYHTYNKRN